MGNLQIYEIQMKAALVYQRNTQKYVGKANLKGVEEVSVEASENPLVNNMLIVLFTGLTTFFSIPSGCWLVNVKVADA